MIKWYFIKAIFLIFDQGNFIQFWARQFLLSMIKIIWVASENVYESNRNFLDIKFH